MKEAEKKNRLEIIKFVVMVYYVKHPSVYRLFCPQHPLYLLYFIHA